MIVYIEVDIDVDIVIVDKRECFCIMDYGVSCIILQESVDLVYRSVGKGDSVCRINVLKLYKIRKFWQGLVFVRIVYILLLYYYFEI